MSQPDASSIHSALLQQLTDCAMLCQLVRCNGVLHLTKKRRPAFFGHLYQTVVNQQLSKQAADSIIKRLQAAAKAQGLTVEALCIPAHADTIRQCGLSSNKVRALIALREALHSGQIAAEIFKTTDAELIIQEIKKLRGFGQWSAEMVALSFFAMPDIWSPQDAALARALTHISACDGIDQAQILQAAAPYRSYLALHLWRAIDHRWHDLPAPSRGR